ncbi:MULTISPECIES: hypothetical protein [unclassified Mycobacterium]|uniref:hypothetical protein n=1 Tax=unclassified Mycobacterium TaxID=2642494 RepID=UPI001E4E5977|nr:MULTISPECIES: hypothetical protein [unclassified Mycobacterium]
MLITETTCVASPTAFANQGAPAAPLIGAIASATENAHAEANSEASSRRMPSIVEPVQRKVK